MERRFTRRNTLVGGALLIATLNRDALYLAIEQASLTEDQRIALRSINGNNPSGLVTNLVATEKVNLRTQPTTITEDSLIEQVSQGSQFARALEVVGNDPLNPRNRAQRSLWYFLPRRISNDGLVVFGGFAHSGYFKQFESENQSNPQVIAIK